MVTAQVFSSIRLLYLSVRSHAGQLWPAATALVIGLGALSSTWFVAPYAVHSLRLLSCGLFGGFVLVSALTTYLNGMSTPNPT